MVRLKILRVKNNSYYILLDENTGKLYTLIFEFHNVESPKPNDYLIFNEKLLDRRFEGFAQPYALRPISDDELESTNEIDVFTLQSNNVITKLKRIFG